MKQSAEVRWFYTRDLPLEVRNWFCGSKLCEEETARTDHYLVLPGSNEVGVKVRGGRKFEVKARTKMPEPFSLATGASVGRQDAWVKWSPEDRDVVGRMVALEGSTPEWVAVAKQRWVRKLRVDAAGRIEETGADAMIDNGCKVELSEVKVRESHWWTLAFETFGEANPAADCPTGAAEANLEQVARHFLKVLPHGLALTERDSMAYPEWLNSLAG